MNRKMKICLSIGAMNPPFYDMIQELSQYAQVDVVGLDGFSLAGYDIFIGKKLKKDILATADRLKAIFAYKTGVDDFPMAELRQRGILLVNSHADATIIAEYAIGLAMSLLYRIPESDKKLRRGVWRDRVNPYWKSFFEVKIGLVGYGHIGKAIHAFLKRNNITAYTLDRGKDYGSDIEVLPTLEALCEVSDLIILSLPKTPGTDRMFDQHLLSAMQGKYLVNVGRSNCIDQQALYHALKDGQLAGAAIDTWDQKPASMLDTLIPFAYPFDQLDNIILSPHQAMQVEAGHENYVEDITQKVLRYLQGQPPTDVVDLNKGY